jgi:hypothetical protein
MNEVSIDVQPSVSKATTAVDDCVLCMTLSPPTYVLGCFAGAALFSWPPRNSAARLSAVARGAPHTPRVMFEGVKFCKDETK